MLYSVLQWPHALALTPSPTLLSSSCHPDSTCEVIYGEGLTLKLLAKQTW